MVNQLGRCHCRSLPARRLMHHVCRSGACGCAATCRTLWCCETASLPHGLPPTRWVAVAGSPEG